MSEIVYISKETIKKLSDELGLNNIDKYTQDWEYEATDSSRIMEFISYYLSNVLTENEKYGLMRLIMESYNDYYNDYASNSEFEVLISNILINEYSVHKKIIEDWACEGDELEDCYAITFLARNVIKSIG